MLSKARINHNFTLEKSVICLWSNRCSVNQGNKDLKRLQYRDKKIDTRNKEHGISKIICKKTKVN